MLERFLHYNFSLFEKKKIILACSGGIDSMTLLHLLKQLNCEIIVCHIDHLTRNGQSTQDKNFVETYCKRNDIIQYSREYHHMGGNFQAESRKFRYFVFQSLLAELDADHIVTAHNMNDNVESYFIRSVRGTGLKGLKGMKSINSPFIRPLLSFRRIEIEEYATENKIPFVEDPSNFAGNYLRNTIRNEILPKIEPYIPNLIERLTKTILNLNRDFYLLEHLIKNVKDKYLTEKDQFIEVDLKGLHHLPVRETLLYHLLKEYGTNEEQVTQVFSSGTGSVFETDEYLLNKDRDRLLIKKKAGASHFTVSIPGPGVFKLPNGAVLQISLTPFSALSKARKDLVLSSSSLQLPLCLRPWKDGDRFCPSGMNGQSKKVSKFLKDLKMPRVQKSAVMVIESNDGRICGLPGYRADHRFLPEANEDVYLIQLVNE